jgi:hypothetical protein
MIDIDALDIASACATLPDSGHGRGIGVRVATNSLNFFGDGSFHIRAGRRI